VDGVRRAVTAAPDVAVLALLAVTIPVAAAVTVGWFVPWLVVPAAVVSLLVLWRLRPEPLRHPGAAGASGVALVAVLVWAVVQVRLAGEYIAVDRDPAVYALTGIWLVDHPAVAVPMTAAAEASAGVEGARTVALGFGASADPLRPQGNHAVPGLVAIAGWVGGVAAVLAANVAIAAVALLGLYGAGRRLVGPVWALLPPAVLALSMPMVAVSRSTYSEPLALAMAAGAATVLAGSLRVAALRDRVGPFLLAGVFAGAVALARVDGGLVLIGAVLAVGVAAALAGVPPRRGIVALGAVTLGGVPLLALGVVDLALNSGDYLTRGREQAGLVAIVVALVVAVVLAGVLVATSTRVASWVERHRPRVAAGVAGAGVLVALVLLSRPWWFVGRAFAESPGFQRDIERYQAAEGLAADGARSYDELTLTWVSWYLGWPATLLGLAGLAAMGYAVVAARRLTLLAALLPLGVPALLYLVYPSITPDHVWAMRRLVTAAVPLLLVGVAFVLAWAWRRTAASRVAAGVAALVVLVWPLTTFSGLYTVRDRVGQVEEAQAACAQVTDGRAVVAGSRPGFDYIATLRIMCDVQVVQLTPVTAAGLARLREQWGGEPLTLLTFAPREVPWTRAPSGPVHEAAIAGWERSLVGPPERAPVQERSLWAGTIEPDGRVTPR
jgi:hypothetical protein